MATLEVTADEVAVRLTALEKLGALHGDVVVPRSSVRSAEALEQPWRTLRWRWRAPGTGVPGVIALGTFRGGGRKDFVALYRKRPAVAVTLDGQPFSRLIVSVDDTDAVVASLSRG